jgi:hypothetical protein
MPHNLTLRGFDDKVHSKLGELANQRGVSINSIVKDAVDKWLQLQSEIPKKHFLIIYSTEEPMVDLLKSMNRLAKEADLFRCFCGVPHSITTTLLTKMKWYNAADESYLIKQDSKGQQYKPQTLHPNQLKEYYKKIGENIVKNASNNQVCCIDLLMDNMTKLSLKEALKLEKSYDENRIPGLMYCAYKTETLLNAEIKDMIDLFEDHDQIFILKEDELYKIHITKENVHKLFLN